MPSPIPAVVLNDVSFSWPDGTVAITDLSGAFSRGRTGLVGLNAVGKSTLLRLIAGQLQPTRGTITAVGEIDYLPQSLHLQAHTTIADLLGVRQQLDAVRAIEAGDSRPQMFDLVGEAWDIEKRSVATLTAIGLPTDLDRLVTTLSGGEVMLTAITGIRLRSAPIALLDEPTNNLDASAREQVAEVVQTWRGSLIVVSHDPDLLDSMDGIAELRDGTLSIYGGGYRDYLETVDRQQIAARQILRTAEQEYRTQRRKRIKAEEQIAHSQRQGHKDAVNRKYLPGVVDLRRNAAEKSQGGRRVALRDREAAALDAIADAEQAIRDDDHISINLPDPGVGNGRRIAILNSADGYEYLIVGPERVALTGPNGVGKTTLVHELITNTPAQVTRIGYLPQRMDVLDDQTSVLDNVRAVAPTVPLGELRNQLAQLLIRGDQVFRQAKTLSGGERFRVTLARLLLAEPPAQLLVLDEPTNNLDRMSVNQLVAALANYRGALLVVSHDRDFLDRLTLDTEYTLRPGGILTKSS